MQYALEQMQGASSRAGKELFAFRDTLVAIENAYKSLQKDNDLIYHYPVPDLRSLPAIERAELPRPGAQLAPTNLSAPTETSPSHGVSTFTRAVRARPEPRTQPQLHPHAPTSIEYTVQCIEFDH